MDRWRVAFSDHDHDDYSVWVRVVDQAFGAVFEQEITANLHAPRQFLSPRLFMNNGATAAVVAYECSGVYVETDF